MAKERLDKLLVSRGLAATRAKAQGMILAGIVYSGEQRLDKPGQMVAVDLPLLLREGLRYVGRGGLKLEAALDHFGIDPAGLDCLDLGASTGGFTDCLLQRGASRVVAVDVGYGQLDWKLRQDPRVEVRERVNARYLAPEDFSQRFDLVVGDLSFISLRLILPVIPPLLGEGGRIIVLIKPQFEVGREEVGRGGIVRSDPARARVVNEVLDCAASLGLRPRGVIESPIRGADGNAEYLACFES